METATKQYKIMVSETNYTAYYIQAQSREEAQRIWAENGYESDTMKIEDSDFTIVGVEQVEGN